MAERKRTVTWQNPQEAAAAAQEVSGLAYLQGMVEGRFPAPPIADLMNFALTEVEERRAVFEVEPAEYHYNPGGAVHGGLAATLCDSAMACAIQSTLPAGTFSTTIELHVNYLRPVTTETGRLRCVGEVIHCGRQVATAEARLVDEDGKLYAHATTTCLIR